MNKEDWTYRKFADAFDLQMGKTPSRDNPNYWNGTNIWVSIADLKERKINATKEQITDQAVSECNIFKVPKGTVIMSFKLSLGKVAISDSDLYTNEAIMAFLPKKDVLLLPEYTFYYLLGYHWQGANKAVMGQTLNKKSISNNVFSYPPLPTQQRIVAELDCISGILEKKRQQLKELDNLAQAIFYDMFGDPVENEMGWKVKKLGEVCSDIVDCPHSTPIKANGITDFPCIRTSELKGGSISWETMQYLEKDEYEKRISRLKPIAGDIVFGREGTIGDAVILPEGYDFSLGQRTMLFRVAKSIMSNVFLHRVILSKWFKMQIEAVNVSSTVAHVNIKDLKMFCVPLPPLSLQQQFTEKIAAIERQKALINQSIKEVQTLFDCRMEEYFG